MSIIDIIVIIIIFIFIIVIIKIFILKKDKTYKWKLYNSSNWINKPYITTFRLENNIIIKDDESIQMTLQDYSKYYEICIYNNNLELIRTIPYPLEVILNLQPNEYIIILRCNGEGNPSWKDSINKIIKKKETHLIQSRSIISKQYSEDFSEEYQTTIKEISNNTMKTYISRQKSIYPYSKYIFIEIMDITLEENQKAILIIPNRNVTLKCEDNIFINGNEIERKPTTFEIFELYGSDQSNYIITQFIYGTEYEYHPFYAFTFQMF
jgi:hypothetical protein